MAPSQTNGTQAKGLSRVLFPILLFFIIVGFYWKLTLTNQYDWVWDPDVSQQVLPFFDEEARQFQHT